MTSGTSADPKKVFHFNKTTNIGKWGTMCNDHYTPSSGKVACRSVGYVNYVERIKLGCPLEIDKLPGNKGHPN